MSCKLATAVRTAPQLSVSLSGVLSRQKRAWDKPWSGKCDLARILVLWPAPVWRAPLWIRWPLLPSIQQSEHDSAAWVKGDFLPQRNWSVRRTRQETAFAMISLSHGNSHVSAYTGGCSCSNKSMYSYASRLQLVCPFLVLPGSLSFI